MPAPIVLDDIRGRIERPLTAEEERTIPNWIDDAWEHLVDQVPRLEARLLLDPAQPDAIRSETAKSVLGRMVERKVRNAAGLRSFGLADGSQATIDNDLSAGEIYVTAEELARFAPRAVAAPIQGVFSIQLGL
jgi:hypothetical protein